ncbi:MAG: peptidoglycan editing factor PgeF [Hyphomicrobium sp.]
MMLPRQASNLTGLPRILHGFFTRQGGVSEGPYQSLNCGLGSSDDPDRVLENRRRVAEALGSTSGGVITLYQEHGATAITVDQPIARDKLPKADAVVSATPGLLIGVLTADCAPVLLADPVAGVVAAAHAGWRGAASGILESAIREMERIGASRSRIAAAVGPCINQDSYEVGPEFERDVIARDAEGAIFFKRLVAGGRGYFDLPGYSAMRLRRAGLANVASAAACTYENESEFFSFRRATHRKEADYGRQISAIVVA